MVVFRTIIKMSSHRARKRIREAKKKARPELSTRELWVEKDYVNTFNVDVERVNDNLERVHVKVHNDINFHKKNPIFLLHQDVSPEEFIRRYEAPYKPVAIRGVTETWSASYKWTLERLKKKYRNQKFKCGEVN